MENNTVKWLNKTIVSLQEWHFQHVQDDLSIPDFIYPPEVGQRPNEFSEDYLQKQRNARIKSIDAAFYQFPQLLKICTDWDNNVLDSCFKKFIFEKSRLDTEEFVMRENYFMSLIHLSGHNLNILHLEEYPYSQMMQFIKIYCPNVKELRLAFKEIKSEDFENVFSNMSHLKSLRIVWQCEDSILPETLVKSFKQVGGTLENFWLRCSSEKNNSSLPYSLVSVFPRLIALKLLSIIDFRVVQPLFQSIGEIKNLEELDLESDLVNTFEYVCPVGLFENLRKLFIQNNDSVTDKFLIGLCSNAKKLNTLCIGGTNITDNGIIALNNLKQLKWLNLSSYKCGLKNIVNELITDKSIQYLFNENLETLFLSHFMKITNRSVIKLLENLPNLHIFYMGRTKTITHDVFEEISKLTKYRKNTLYIYVSLDDFDLAFPRLKESHNIIINNQS